LFPTLLMAALAAMALFVVGLLVDVFALRLAAKPWPHLAALAFVAAYGQGRFARQVGAGLALCMVGDLLLEFRQALFLPGIGVFLLGHAAFILAFASDVRTPALARGVPFVVWVGVVFGIVRGGLGPLQVPVVVYMALISIMMWRAAARVGTRGHWSEWAGLVGAVLFACGDTLIALDRFHAPIPGVRYPIILTYWAALALLASTVLRDRPTPG
jgi:uncharacterized membrane protein YhhN